VNFTDAPRNSGQSNVAQNENGSSKNRKPLPVELAEANRRARLERQERIDKEVHRRELNDLRFQSAQQRAWQNNVQSSFRQTLAYQQRQSTIAEIDSIINPPAPPPEPEPTVVADNGLGSPNIGDEGFNPRYWLQKPIFRR
jgi:hypothetical protein